MKIHIELNDDISEDEVIIRCRQITGQIQKIQKILQEETKDSLHLTFLKDSQEYYFPLKNIIFFETSDNSVYAHTRADIFRIKFRLYELEDFLPHSFVRISKSAIVNIDQILMVNRNLTSSSLIKFYKSHKQVYVSRRYYKELNTRLNERSYHED